MSEREDYSDEEWATVVSAPVAVIAAVIGASPGGPLAIMQEVGAAVKAFERAAEERRANPLIAAVLVTLKGRFEAFMGKAGDPAAEQVDIMELGKDPERAVAAVAAARELLARKAPPEHAAELRAWLYELAVDVAHAAPEGGFLGMGGEQVSAPEQAMLDRLAEALAVTPP
ncbi:MAG TPA: hypothetical protein PKD53_14435 [Chloroflexaceae bacterium]|nr:hypothetical protein [Chloroflexaceae bacterium]